MDNISQCNPRHNITYTGGSPPPEKGESTVTGAIEFLRKAKAICKSQKICSTDCPVDELCGNACGITNEADLVRKVMAYKIKEETKC